LLKLEPEKWQLVLGNMVIDVLQEVDLEEIEGAEKSYLEADYYYPKYW